MEFTSLIARDISDIKSAQVALEERQRRLMRAQHVAHMGFLEFDLERNTIEWSDEVYRLYGVDPSEDTTDPSFTTGLTHPDDRVRALENLDRAARGLPFEAIDHRIVRPNGAIVWVHAEMELIRGPDGAPARLLGTVVDITGRMEAEADLRLFRVLIDHSTDAIEVIDPETGRFLDVNATGCEALGYTRAELLGLCVHDVDPLIGPAGFAQAMQALHESGSSAMRSVHQRKDGSTFPVEINLAVVQLDRPYVVAVSRDISQRVEDEAERRTLEAQLRQSNKMEAVGTLAGGVAHDFNNVLAVISITTELLLDGLEPGDARRDDLAEIRDASTRAATLTRQLLAFSRQQALSPRVLDLNAVVSSIETMVCRLIGEDVDVAVRLDPTLGAVTADPGQVEQVVMNLAANARGAMTSGGKLTIETSNVDLDEAYAATHAGAPTGSFALLAVTDNGTGMDEETRARAFEPFFTTKGVGEGTGLGLSTVYGIVKQSGGHVSIYSEVGTGTTVKVYLPHAKSSVDEEVPQTERPAMPLGSGTILVAEDEDTIRGLVVRVLESNGFRVLSAAHGEEALRVAAAHESTIDVLITDVILPGMTGPELSEQLGFQRCDLKTLFVSGYPGQAIARQGVLDQGVAFLPKPFTPEVLLRRVHELLSE